MYNIISGETVLAGVVAGVVALGGARARRGVGARALQRAGLVAQQPAQRRGGAVRRAVAAGRARGGELGVVAALKSLTFPYSL